MPDWLQGAVVTNEPVPSAPVLAVRLALALLFGLAVAAIHSMTLGRRRIEAGTLPTTLVMLAVLIALVTVVIGNSVARAFGLVGALSIVRFRTVVEDTRDTAFVIFAVIVGMGAGAGYLGLTMVGIPIVGLAAVFMCWLMPSNGNGKHDQILQVRIGLGLDPEVTLNPVLQKHLAQVTLKAVGTTKQGSALELTYSVRLRETGGMLALVADLNRTEGVQGVEFKGG